MPQLKPQLLAQIEFTEWTPDRHLRHSWFVGLREDKAVREVVREGQISKSKHMVHLRRILFLSFSFRFLSFSFRNELETGSDAVFDNFL